MNLRTIRGGFTLIELLTVITIIAVLCSVLFPVYVNVKKSAYRATCQSNLSQIAKAFESYTSDNNGCYPNLNSKCLWMGRYWRWPMKHYVGYTAGYDSKDPLAEKQTTRVWNSILRCPADPVPGSVYDGTSYGISAAFYHTPDQINAMSVTQLYDDSPVSFATIKTSAIKYPGKKALAADWISHTPDKSTWWAWGGSRNYLFPDGHVMYLSADKVKPAVDNLPDINLTRNGVEGKDID